MTDQHLSQITLCRNCGNPIARAFDPDVWFQVRNGRPTTTYCEPSSYSTQAEPAETEWTEL